MGQRLFAATPQVPTCGTGWRIMLGIDSARSSVDWNRSLQRVPLRLAAPLEHQRHLHIMQIMRRSGQWAVWCAALRCWVLLIA